MSHERRVGVRFESRARGALRGPRAALHRVAGRAPAARPCVRLIAIGEAVWPCVRLIAIGEAVLDSHVLDDSCVPYPCAAGSAGYCNGRSLPANPANPKPIRKLPPVRSGPVRGHQNCAGLRQRVPVQPRARQTPNAKRNRETPLFHPPRRAGRARARAVGVRRMHSDSPRFRGTGPRPLNRPPAADGKKRDSGGGVKGP